jgi:membrane-associated protease RseP (regulator of RpoE activity)
MNADDLQKRDRGRETDAQRIDGIPRRQSPMFHSGMGSASQAGSADAPGSWVRRLRLHVLLFLATVASTTLVGFYFAGTWSGALGYSAAIISILLFHEMGHFVLCLRYRVPATLPYFIPIPALPFGTMGAVIRMRGQLRSRQSILDIGAAGPLAGLIIAIPLLFWGLQRSTLAPVGELSAQGGFRLGESLLFGWIAGLALPNPGGDLEILLHPVAMAGWAGLFVTGLNLLPIGQLDGGHILYALLGTQARWAGRLFLLFLAGLTLFVHRGWWPLILLLLFFVRTGHPPPIDPRPLGRGRTVLALAMMALFVVTFVPRPLAWVGP